MKGSIDSTAFGWMWPGTPSHAHTTLYLLQIIACSYLEVYKDIKGGTVYYIEQKKKAIISTYCGAVVCPRLEIRQEKGLWIHPYVFSDT